MYEFCTIESNLMSYAPVQNKDNAGTDQTSFIGAWTKTTKWFTFEAIIVRVVPKMDLSALCEGDGHVNAEMH